MQTSSLAIILLPCVLMAITASADDLVALGGRLAGQIGVFFDALNGTSVLESLHDDGPYTIFAPSDDASQNYSWPSNQTELADLIRYHIVRGNYSTDLLNGTMEALDGSVIVSEPIDIDNERIIAVNDAYVVEGDHYFDNGVLHIIAKVLDPTYQSEANQNVNGDDRDGGNDVDDDNTGQQGQQQGQQQQQPYNGYNEAARPPYVPQGHGAAPYQAQNPTGIGGFGLPGLGGGGPGAGLNQNNGAGLRFGLNGDRRPMLGGNPNNNEYDDGNGLAGGGGGGGFAAHNPNGGLAAPQSGGLGGGAQEGDDQDPISQGLPQGDSDPIVSSRPDGDQQQQQEADGPATGLDSWGQPPQQHQQASLDPWAQQAPLRPRTLMDDGGFGAGIGGGRLPQQQQQQQPLGEYGGGLPLAQQQRPAAGGGSLLQSPVFGGERMSPMARPGPFNPYAARPALY